ncbi:hypothetical protein ANN_01169 [Periplaneta americana]|uniref:Secreted protein n=1 Tax=Periplaneta americana TaxID=6978 RepID=A0ABQ8TVV9_PERAM|nr:hypothetical protein ANN_01169 [Periplaneta americana]
MMVHMLVILVLDGSSIQIHAWTITSDEQPLLIAWRLQHRLGPLLHPECQLGSSATACWKPDYDQKCRSPGFLSHLITLQLISDDAAKDATGGMTDAELCLVMTDESRFCLCVSDGRLRVRRRP